MHNSQFIIRLRIECQTATIMNYELRIMNYDKVSI